MFPRHMAAVGHHLRAALDQLDQGGGAVFRRHMGQLGV
jgi:hypothetical protein